MAERGNLFHEGDELIEVNGKSMRGLDVNEVGDTIASMNGSIVFVLASPNKQVNGFSGNQPYEVVVSFIALYLSFSFSPCFDSNTQLVGSDWYQVVR